MSKKIEHVVIERAIELLEKGWCDASWAEDKKGRHVAWDEKRAVKFCAEGAIRRAALDILGKDKQRVAGKIIKSFDETPEAYYLLNLNHRSGKKAVLSTLRNRLRRL